MLCEFLNPRRAVRSKQQCTSLFSLKAQLERLLCIEVKGHMITSSDVRPRLVCDSSLSFR